MSAKCVRNHDSSPPGVPCARRNRRGRTFSRRLNLEQLEWRNLLTGGFEFVEADALLAPEVVEQKPAAEVAEVTEETRDGSKDVVVTREVAEAVWTEVYEEEPVADDGAFGVTTAYFAEEVPVEESPFLAFSTSASFDREKTDEPVMLTDPVSEGDELEPPLRMFTMAGADDTEDTFDPQTLEVESDGIVEPVLFTDFATDDELAFATGDDLSNEIMLMSAAGPSPWQNVDDPDDVNVDGWTTAVDALLVINRVNNSVPLLALATLEVTYFVDVNGDRALDANDAVQVINTLNEGELAPSGADAARVAPIWYDGSFDDSPALQDAIAPEESDPDDVTNGAGAEDQLLMVPRLALKEDASDEATEESVVGSEDSEKPDASWDDSLLFSEEMDWLLPELL